MFEMNREGSKCRETCDGERPEGHVTRSLNEVGLLLLLASFSIATSTMRTSNRRDFSASKKAIGPVNSFDWAWFFSVLAHVSTSILQVGLSQKKKMPTVLSFDGKYLDGLNIF